ncbi:MAG: hypothetical protein IKK51_04470 [Oscillospiraceae bacterium]|nr:hypothetical protein [Oscillospiraceae bacterium]MBR4101116.1 hypothetical protein [Oscillospiraceae bacterium]MBR6617588.1 hypothetical protein [Oscillospiraceae bacterium]
MEDLFGKMQELMSDPESMKQLSELAQMLQEETGGGNTEGCSANADTAEDSLFGGIPFDPIMLMKLGEMFGSTQKPDDNTALLLALRPHLRSHRRERVDRAVRLLRLMTVFGTLKDSGMLENIL